MKFPIIPSSKTWFSLSALLVAASLFFLLSPGFGLKAGIDFTGGSKMYLPFSEPIARQEFTDIFRETLGDDKGEIVVESGENAILVRSRTLENSEIESLKSAFAEKGNRITEDAIRVETVGPTQGAVQTRNGFIAVGITLLAIVLFISLAFRKVPHGLSSWKLGLAAIVALLHDVTIIAGIFALLGKFYGVEVDTLFITALLTVMGFSVHDTIVVFDRLRENLRGVAVSELPQVAEKSVWETMARSLHTSISTVIVLVAILLAKIEGIHFFVLALTAGIVIGTYSSIFLATPLLVAWSKQK